MHFEHSVNFIKPNPNPDPITGEPGSHPFATAAGAAVICAVCAYFGSMMGPLGIAIGGAAGAIAGGFTGNALGESMDPTVKDESIKSNGRSTASSHPYGKYIPSYKRDYARTSNLMPLEEVTPVQPAPTRPPDGPMNS